MIVRFLGNSFPQHLLSAGFTIESQMDLTQGKEYKVYSIVGWREDSYYCVISDVDIPFWAPSAVFETVNDQIPEDWKYTEVYGELKFLFGPEKLVKNEALYSALVNLEPDAVDCFWQYVESNS